MCDCEKRLDALSEAMKIMADKIMYNEQIGRLLINRTMIIACAIEQLSEAVDALDSRTVTDNMREWGSAINTPGNITDGSYPGWDEESYKVHCCDDCGAKWRSDKNGDICVCGKKVTGQ